MAPASSLGAYLKYGSACWLFYLHDLITLLSRIVIKIHDLHKKQLYLILVVGKCV